MDDEGWDWQIVEEGLAGRPDQAQPEVPSAKQWEKAVDFISLQLTLKLTEDDIQR